jgi:hypothetical protein
MQVIDSEPETTRHGLEYWRPDAVDGDSVQFVEIAVNHKQPILLRGDCVT